MKAQRQNKILEIVAQKDVETQEHLARSLQEAGFNVTQATVSRDIKELGLIKVPSNGGGFCYRAPGWEVYYHKGERLKEIFIRTVTNVDYSGNIIVIKTLPGEAQAVALAVDRSGWKEVIGTVGGDDTVLAVIKPLQSVKKVWKRFFDLSSG